MSPPLITMFLDYILKLFEENFQSALSAIENGCELFNGVLEFIQFIFDFLNIQLCELVKAAFGNSLGLLLGEVEALDFRILLISAKVSFELVSGVRITTYLDALSPPFLSSPPAIEASLKHPHRHRQ